MKTIWLTLLLAAVTLCAAESQDPRKEIAELHLKDGTVLHHVQIVSYSTTAAMAKWDEGRGTIAYENFPEEWQNELLKFRPEQSRAPIYASSQYVPNSLSQFPPVNMAPLESLPEQPACSATTSTCWRCSSVMTIFAESTKPCVSRQRWRLASLTVFGNWPTSMHC